MREGVIPAVFAGFFSSALPIGWGLDQLDGQEQRKNARKNHTVTTHFPRLVKAGPREDPQSKLVFTPHLEHGAWVTENTPG